MSGTGRAARAQGESRSAPPAGAVSESGLAAEDNGLGLRVVVEGLDAVLLAIPAGLPAPEGQLVVDLGPRVDPGVAGLDALGGVAGASQITRPHRGPQPERGGAGAGER